MNAHVRSITSAQNPLFRDLRDCLQSRGIKKHKLFIVAGARAVAELLAARPELAKYLLLLAGQAHAEQLVYQLRTKSKSCQALSLEKPLFAELDVFGTSSPLLVLETPEVPDASLSEPPRGLEILCALSDPSNLGALVRSAAAFRASRIVPLRESASPFHPKATRAASATTLLTPFAKGPSISELGETTGLIALDMHGTPLDRFQWPKDARLLMGEEGLGLPTSLAATRVSIPMASAVESLNATVAASLALYSYRLRHSL